MGSARNKITLDQIISINRQMINRFGGVFFDADNNLLKKGSLEFALDEIDAVIFGQALHPDLFDKAATLMYKIIAGHVFHDGNKRTGLAAGQLLIMLNGYDLPLHQISAEAVTVAEKVATRQINVDELTEWLRKRSVPL